MMPWPKYGDKGRLINRHQSWNSRSVLVYRIKLVKKVIARLLPSNVLMRAHQLLVLLPKAVREIERNIDR